MANEKRYKLLKNRYNDLCSGRVVLEDNEISISAGLSTLNVNEKGIDLQPNPTGHVSFSTYNIKQPGSKQSSLPMDFLPGLWNVTPRKTFDVPLVEEIAELAAITISISAYIKS
jgi:hypothetical protein